MDILNEKSSLLAIAPTPHWVITDHVFKCPVQHEAPYTYPVVDYQQLITEQRIEAYVHTQHWINDASRIEDASLLIEELHQGSQSMQLHELMILRNGQQINALDEDNISINQRELGLESHISNNSITVSISVDDLRVGDCLKVSYTIVERCSDHPFHGRTYLRNFLTSWSCPVDRQRIRILNHSTKKLSVLTSELVNLKEKITHSEIQNDEVWERNFKNLPLRRIPQSTPNWYWGSFIQVTSAGTWPDVSAYLYHYYQGVEANQLIDPLVLDGLNLFNTNDSLPDKTLKIIRFVQNEVRYKGENQGIFTHTPKDPNRVLKKRAGDCKDKSNLILALLKALGVPAHLVLVHSNNGDKVNVLNPSAYQFNHMIVAVELGGHIHYFDATIKKQGGDLSYYTKLNYGYGLPITELGSELAKIRSVSDALTFHIQHEFDFSSLGKQDSLCIRREYWGVRADNMRAQLASVSQEQNELDYNDWAVESTQLDLERIDAIHIVSDDLKINHLCTQESYIIKDVDKTHKGKKIELSTPFYKDLYVTNTPDTPIRIDLYGQTRHTIRVKYNKRPEMQSTNEVVDSYGFHYRDTVGKVRGNEYEYVTTLTPKPVFFIPAGSLAQQHNNDVERIRHRSNNLICPKNAGLFTAQGLMTDFFYYAVFLALALIAVIMLDN